MPLLPPHLGDREPETFLPHPIDWTTVQFNVVVFASATTRVGVVGDAEELGTWRLDRVVPLYPMARVRSDLCPTWFSACIKIPTDLAKAEYKFVMWHDNKIAHPFPMADVDFPLPPSIVNQEATEPPAAGSIPSQSSGAYAKSARGSQTWAIDDLRLPLPPEELRIFYLKSPASAAEERDLNWEGRGSKDNRFFILQPDKVSIPANKDPKLVHIWDPQNIVDPCGICGAMTNYPQPVMMGPMQDQEAASLRSDSGLVTPPQDVIPTSYYALPPADFIDLTPCDTGGFSPEYIHTTRYYHQVKDTQSIHFNQIIPRIYCGSCPRRLAHLRMLKDEYNVGGVFNFQAVDDLRENWIDDKHTPICDDRTPDRLHEIYRQQQLALFHIPTVDMSTQGRSNMIAQAAWLVGGYLASNPHKSIYIHCNAGVGRAIACVCGFLHCCLRLPLQHTLNFVRRMRPVAYVDRVALAFGRYDFDNKFLNALPFLGLPGLEDAELSVMDGGYTETQVDTESDIGDKTHEEVD